MDMNNGNYTMLTDFYQITMDAAYLDNGKEREMATFDLFVRSLPKDWGYLIANGVDDAVDFATSIRFEPDDIEFLNSQGIFNDEFLGYLEGFRFSGDIYAMPEGTPVAAGEPLMVISGKKPEAQYLESALLNDINFQTMIASKASRIVNAAGDAKVVDFGLRRAQGKYAAMRGARAAYLAGCVGTSNVKAAKDYGIPVSGTMAHSFVMSFDEEDAFRAYVKTFPKNATLLIDTYDTLEGARKAVRVGKDLEKEGKRLGAVRLDSGDLTALSKDVRKILDDGGLEYVKITASNDLNEYKIHDQRENGARIDSYGVGTEMITAKPIAAIPGVYKLAEDDNGPKIKLAEGKKTFPGRKQVFRHENDDGKYLFDTMALDGERVGGIPLLEPVVKNGERVVPRKNLGESRKYCMDCVSRLPESAREVRVVQPYEMRISEGLVALTTELERAYSKVMGK